MKQNAAAATKSADRSDPVSIGRQAPEVLIAPPGPKSRAIAARVAAVESPAFEARRDSRTAMSHAEQSPIVYARGVGSNVWDADGNRYVDLIAGFGALPLGHEHPAIAAAMNAQAGDILLALGDVYATEVKAELCERLVAMFPERGARVMLGLSGADAITAALKTAMMATGRPGVLAFRGGYHGLSYAPLAACGLNDSFRDPFRAQLGDHVTFAHYPTDEASLEDTMTHAMTALASGEIGAVLVEPILGRGGCVVPPDEFLPQLRSLCDQAGALLIVDEIWTGLGRSGQMLASKTVVPDLVCLGKALGGGLPISACLGRESVMRAWGKHGGSTIHTATHFGWPLACATALACLNVIEREKLATRAAEVGTRWVERMRARGLRVRGRGLMVGVELDDAARALTVSRALLAKGWLVLTGGVRGEVLTLTPALDIDESLLAGFTDTLSEITRSA